MDDEKLIEEMQKEYNKLNNRVKLYTFDQIKKEIRKGGKKWNL